MLSIAIYNFILAILFPLFSPYVIYQTLRRWKEWKERLGFTPRFSERNTIWLHGASVGEINSLKSFYDELSMLYPDKKFLITSYTRTGVKRAEEIFNSSNCKIGFFPFDLMLAVIISILRVKPEIIYFTETEIWPNFLSFSKIIKIPVVLIGARLSEKSFPRYKAFRRFLKPFLSAYSLVLVQDELNKKKWLELGINKEKLQVGGSLKTKTYNFNKPAIGLEKDVMLWIAGPIRKGEADCIINAYMELKKPYKILGLLIAPRYMEMLEEIKKLIISRDETFNLRSELRTIPNGITILDTIGELSAFYSLASFAFIGGSLIKAGGHNPLEAAFQGVPVLMGPYCENVEKTVKKLIDGKGAFIVNNSDDIIKVINKLISDENLRITTSVNIKKAAVDIQLSEKSLIDILKREGFVQ